MVVIGGQCGRPVNCTVVEIETHPTIAIDDARVCVYKGAAPRHEKRLIVVIRADAQFHFDLCRTWQAKTRDAERLLAGRLYVREVLITLARKCRNRIPDHRCHRQVLPVEIDRYAIVLHCRAVGPVLVRRQRIRAGERIAMDGQEPFRNQVVKPDSRLAFAVCGYDVAQQVPLVLRVPHLEVVETALGLIADGCVICKRGGRAASA